jgi:hypothetical protein
MVLWVKANQLVKFYLYNRHQRVLISNKYSNKYFSAWEIIKKGVPQGSHFGPLVFILYINNLPHTIKDVSKPILFADDTSIIIQILIPWILTGKSIYYLQT